MNTFKGLKHAALFAVAVGANGCDRLSLTTEGSKNTIRGDTLSIESTYTERRFGKSADCTILTDINKRDETVCRSLSCTYSDGKVETLQTLVCETFDKAISKGGELGDIVKDVRATGKFFSSTPPR